MTILGRTFTRQDLNRVIWSAIFAFIAALSSATITDVKTAKVAIVAAGAAALAALMSAVKNLLLDDGSTIK